MDQRPNNSLRRRRPGQGGFTLIELLVVIAVLSVLATVVLLNITGVKNKGQAAGCATDVKTVQTAVDAYLNDGVSPALTAAADFKPQLTTLYSKGYIHDTTTACNVLASASDGNGGLNITGN